MVSRIPNSFIIMIFSLFCLPNPVYANPVTSPYFFDDWVSDPSMHNLCHGYYLQQPLPFPGISKQLLGRMPLSITADHGQFTAEGNSTVTGHIHLNQGNTQLYADKAIIHRDAKKQKPIDLIKAEGH